MFSWATILEYTGDRKALKCYVVLCLWHRATLYSRAFLSPLDIYLSMSPSKSYACKICLMSNVSLINMTFLKYIYILKIDPIQVKSANRAHNSLVCLKMKKQINKKMNNNEIKARYLALFW